MRHYANCGSVTGRLARLAQLHLRATARGLADGEDVALAAFDSLVRGVAEGRYPRLDDRDDLWKILTTIALRKASNQRRHEGQLKRGGGRVVGRSGLADDADGDPLPVHFAGTEPTPELPSRWLKKSGSGSTTSPTSPSASSPSCAWRDMRTRKSPRHLTAARARWSESSN